MRIALAAAIGVGVAVLMWLGFRPEPETVRTTLCVIGAYIWAFVGLEMNDRLPSKHKSRDFEW